MKKWLGMFLVFTIVISLAGCGGNTGGSDSQSSSIDVPPQESSSIASPEPAYPETETLDFLNEEQIQLYETAKKMAQMFVFDAGNIQWVLPNTRISNESVQVDGYNFSNYYLVEGPYSQYDDFKTYMLQFYTENYFDTMSKPHFVSYNGKLAILNASMGGNVSRSGVDDTYQLLEKTDDKLSLIHIYFSRAGSGAQELPAKRDDRALVQPGDHCKLCAQCGGGYPAPHGCWV